MNSTATELEFTRRRAMRGIMKIFVIAVFAAAILALVTATPSEALKRRPTVDSVDVCINGKGDKSCDGKICSCCYEDGCWICGDYYYDCVWDPAYRKGRGVTRPLPGGVSPGGAVSTDVAPTTTVPPRRLTPQVAPGVQPPVAR
jgi:hypothetical protein